MNKPLVLKTDQEVIICFNGKRLVQPLEMYKDMTDDEIIKDFNSKRKRG